VEEANDQEAEAEQDGVVAKRVWEGKGDAEHRCRRSQHHEANAVFVGIQCAGQPGVARPCPPDGCEGKRAADDAVPGWIVGEEARDLGDREHEHEVEEELERCD
jgi:hypothetical protein